MDYNHLGHRLIMMTAWALIEALKERRRWSSIETKEEFYYARYHD